MLLLITDTFFAFFEQYKGIFGNIFAASFYLVVLIWLIKLVLLHKFALSDFIFGLIAFGPYLLIKNLYHDYLTGYVAIMGTFAVLYILFALFMMNRLNNMSMAMTANAMTHLKNAEYDYFVTVDRKDTIKDMSISLANKLGLELKQIKKLRFWDVFAESFNVVSINEHLFSEEYQETFKEEYLRQDQLNVSYQFRFESRNDDGEIDHYTIIVKPVFFGHRYLGKNLFIDRNRWQILTKLNEALGNLMADYDRAKGQSHALLSMTSGVLLYFDYQTGTYVMTETFRKVLNTPKTEFTKTELLEQMHPDDVQKYVSLCGNINTQEVTSIVFRMKINNKYRKIVEEAMYLEDKNSQVSVIKTLPIREENSDNVDYLKTVMSQPSINASAKDNEAAPGDDLKSLEEKMQQTDLNRLESLLQSAIKKRE